MCTFRKCFFVDVCILALLIGFGLSGGLSTAQAAHTSKLISISDLPSDLTQLSLEELMEIEITSVSKKPETLSNAAAAIFVITSEDIRRSGVTMLPEALRMAPGINVARMDADKWAISARGHNDYFANKLLVLVDGRTVYTPLFSGTFWDVLDLPLELVDRIEVIRGPGAALWGANAVNGVINIITKSAENTQNSYLSLALGTEDRHHHYYRYGGKIGEDTAYRVYGKFRDTDSFVDADGRDRGSGWDDARAGFRVDSQLSPEDTLTLMGDAYTGELHLNYLLPVNDPPYLGVFQDHEDTYGAYLLSKWTRELSETDNVSLQLFYDFTKRDSPVSGNRLDIFDLEFQHVFSLGERQELVWGAGYRFVTDHLQDRFTFSFDPDERDDHIFNFFLQDDIALVPERLHLILGSKFEHNEYSGFEAQPNARLLWTPTERQSVWAAVSRAVRTPSRIDQDLNSRIFFTADDARNIIGFPFLIDSQAANEFESEELIAFELGYRMLVSDSFSFDWSLFYNEYDDLRSAELITGSILPAPFPGMLMIEIMPGNKMQGSSYGMELAADFRPADWWTLRPAYSALKVNLTPKSGSTDFVSESMEGWSPHHQLSLRSSMNLSRQVELDLWLRYTDSLPAVSIPDYLVLDARLAWHPHENLEIVMGAQNGLDRTHPEYRARALGVEVERSVYCMMNWQF